jgi:hypothetical protein
LADTIKMTLPDGTEVDAVDVAIDESTERFCEFTFADGTKARAKITITEVRRALNDYDPEGRPWYRMNVQPMVAVVAVPPDLMKKKDD